LVQKQIPEQATARGISEDAVIRDVLLAAQPTKRFVEVTEIAALAVFLCSDDARSITGTTLPVMAAGPRIELKRQQHASGRDFGTAVDAGGRSELSGRSLSLH
jgi:NAD(P)-dependent dehydrogenase (short-subunit alcohol dehydrogenase family)